MYDTLVGVLNDDADTGAHEDVEAVTRLIRRRGMTWLLQTLVESVETEVKANSEHYLVVLLTDLRAAYWNYKRRHEDE